MNPIMCLITKKPQPGWHPWVWTSGGESGRTPLTTGMFECEVMTLAPCCQSDKCPHTLPHFTALSHTSSGLLAHLHTRPQSYLQWGTHGEKGSNQLLCLGKILNQKEIDEYYIQNELLNLSINTI